MVSTGPEKPLCGSGSIKIFFDLRHVTSDKYVEMGYSIFLFTEIKLLAFVAFF